ncbi:MAG: hypothetical protein AAF846_26575 [Chloroflexota bacterium]
MAIEVSWGNDEQTYVYIRVENAWTWSDYRASLEQANELIESVVYDVAIITHMVNPLARHLPRNAFLQWGKSIQNNPANLKTVIVVPGEPRVRVFVNTADRLFGNILSFRFRMAETLEEAQKIVRELHPTSIEI